MGYKELIVFSRSALGVTSLYDIDQRWSLQIPKYEDIPLKLSCGLAGI